MEFSSNFSLCSHRDNKTFIYSYICFLLHLVLLKMTQYLYMCVYILQGGRSLWKKAMTLLWNVSGQMQTWLMACFIGARMKLYGCSRMIKEFTPIIDVQVKPDRFGGEFHIFRKPWKMETYPYRSKLQRSPTGEITPVIFHGSIQEAP